MGREQDGAVTRISLELVALALVACSARELPPAPEVEPAQAVHPEPVSRALRLQHLSHELPEAAPSLILDAPSGLVALDAPVVLYLHGWEGCAAAIAGTGPTACVPGGPEREGWGIAALHAASARPGVLLIPQLAYDAQSSTAGGFEDPEFARAWWAEVQGALHELGMERPGPVLAFAHSGGYRTLQALLRAELDPPIEGAGFLDGLYGGADAVADWAAGAPGRRVVSVYTDNSSTTGQSRALAEQLERALGDRAVEIDPVDLDRAARTHLVVVARTAVSHGEVPRATLTGLLSAWVQ